MQSSSTLFVPKEAGDHWAATYALLNLSYYGFPTLWIPYTSAYILVHTHDTYR